VTNTGRIAKVVLALFPFSLWPEKKGGRERAEALAVCQLA